MVRLIDQLYGKNVSFCFVEFRSIVQLPTFDGFLPQTLEWTVRIACDHASVPEVIERIKSRMSADLGKIRVYRVKLRPRDLKMLAAVGQVSEYSTGEYRDVGLADPRLSVKGDA